MLRRIIVGVFKDPKYRNSVRGLQLMSQIIANTNGDISAYGILRCKHAPAFSSISDVSSSDKPISLHKRDLLLLVAGDTKWLERGLLSDTTVMPEGLTLTNIIEFGICEVSDTDLDYYFDLTNDEVVKQVHGNATELMEPKKSELAGLLKGVTSTGPEADIRAFYIMLDEEGFISAGWKDKIEEAAKEGGIEYLCTHLILYEGFAKNEDEAKLIMDAIMKCTKAYGYDPLEGRAFKEMPLVDYYNALFIYFRALCKNPEFNYMPANFWEWLEDEDESRLFDYAMIFVETGSLMWDDEDLENYGSRWVLQMMP